MLSKIGLHYIGILLICPTLLYLLFRVLMKGKSLKKRVTMKDMKWKCIVGMIRYVFVLFFCMLCWYCQEIKLSAEQESYNLFNNCSTLLVEGGQRRVGHLKVGNESVIIQGPHWITFNLFISLSLCKNCTGLEFYILMFCWKNSSFFSCLVSVMCYIFLFKTFLGSIHHLVILYFS